MRAYSLPDGRERENTLGVRDHSMWHDALFLTLIPGFFRLMSYLVHLHPAPPLCSHRAAEQPAPS